MISCRFTALLTIALGAAGFADAAWANKVDPLFSDSATLNVRLIAPIEKLMEERPDKDELEGRFELLTPDGELLSFAVDIRTRGNYRRRPDICPFAPLRLDFKKKELKDTYLDGQNRLKLVTHCVADKDSYQQAVVKEYLAYRIFNILTNASFQVRLLNITYEDSETQEEISSYGILIESKERLAERLELEEHQTNAIPITFLDKRHTNLGSVFQYFVGNLDFSPVAGNSSVKCCHNYALFRDADKNHWSIPYDFDLTSFVEVPYLEPNPKYKQRHTRQRIYRGRCYNQDVLPETLQRFRDQKIQIDSLIAFQDELKDSSRKRVRSFTRDFYKDLEDEPKLIKKFSKACI